MAVQTSLTLYPGISISVTGTTSGSPLTLMKYLDEFLFAGFLVDCRGNLTPGGLVQAA